MAFEELTKRHAAMWGSAPFENIAPLIAEMHVALVDRLGPREGERWLDLGCGAGDVAFLAARAGARVTGSDLSPELIATAKRRAEDEGLELTLEVGDCQDLPYPDGSFDVVSSSVGVIFAPDHERAAAELARVCHPGARIGLTAWRQSSGVGAMFGAMMPFMQPPPRRSRLAAPVGRRVLRRADARQQLRARLRRARHAPRGRRSRRDVEVLPRELRSGVHASGTLSTSRSGPSSTPPWKRASGAIAPRTGGSTWSGSTSSPPGCDGPSPPRPVDVPAGGSLHQPVAPTPDVDHVRKLGSRGLELAA